MQLGEEPRHVRIGDEEDEDLIQDAAIRAHDMIARFANAPAGSGRPGRRSGMPAARSASNLDWSEASDGATTGRRTSRSTLDQSAASGGAVIMPTYTRPQIKFGS
jgi:hypothetical protein